MSNFEKLYQKTLQGLEEALGVPENIAQEARRVYQEFLILLDSSVESKILKDFNLDIGNKTFKDLKISLKTIPDKDLTLKSFSVPIEHFFDVTIRKSKIDQKSASKILHRLFVLHEQYFQEHQVLLLISVKFFRKVFQTYS